MTEFTNNFSKSQWESKYKFGDEQTIDDTFLRVASAVASVEKDKKYWTEQFFNLLQDFKFIPGGRILSNAGTGLKSTTLLNCYVDGFTGDDQDSIEGIYNALFRQAKTLQSEGGYGFCADVMRPRGANIAGIANQSPGAVKFLELWDKSSEIITAGSGEKSKSGEKNFIRKGAQMVTMSCWHPDIEEFITAKQTAGRLSKFNMSVLVTDEFMKAVENDKDWNLEFPNYKEFPNVYKKQWDGNIFDWKKITSDSPYPSTIIHKTLKARDLWKLITESTYNRNEPGVLFVDTMNRMNNLYYCEQINATNPCGEQILPKHGVCLLGSINLTQYIDHPQRTFDWEKLKHDIPIIVRFLDNVNDITNVPLPEQKETMLKKRRIGMGVIGYASSLLRLKIPYGAKSALNRTEGLMDFIVNTAYQASSDIAKEKRSFPDFDSNKYLESQFVKVVLSDETKELIKEQGMRNSHICSIQPTGNTSVFANLVSSSCEPIFNEGYVRTYIVDHPPEGLLTPRHVDWSNKTIEDTSKEIWKWTKEGDENILITEHGGETYKFDRNRGLTKEEWIEDYAVSLLKKDNEWDQEKLQDAKWKTFAMNLDIDAHINTLKIFAKYIDSAISKTINVPNNYPFADFQDVYFKAWKAGIKGITTYREGTMTNVLSTKSSKKSGIAKTDAPKRPKELDCDVHHITIKSQPYFVLVGLYEEEPYEVFAGKNGVVGKKVKKGCLIKQARGRYKAIFEDETELSPIGAFTSDEEDTVTRLISTSLRHGASIAFVVHQLEKAKGELQSFSKCIARALKKYIPDGVEIFGDECPECKGGLIRQDGCTNCKDCGWSKCA